MENGTNYFSLGMMVLLISFLGYLLENIWLAFTRGYIDNRNMRLPFLLGYGLIVIGIYFLIGTPQDITLFGKWHLQGEKKWLYFLMTTVIISLGEISLGSFVERFFGFVYWNYEWIPYHLTKYTSLPTSLGFAAIICMFMEYVFPEVSRILTLHDTTILRIMCVMLLLFCIADFVASFRTMYQKKGLNERWRIEKSAEDGICFLHI